MAELEESLPDRREGLFADLLEQQEETIDRSINDIWDVRLKYALLVCFNWNFNVSKHTNRSHLVEMNKEYLTPTFQGIINIHVNTSYLQLILTPSSTLPLRPCVPNCDTTVLDNPECISSINNYDYTCSLPNRDRFAQDDQPSPALIRTRQGSHFLQRRSGFGDKLRKCMFIG